MSMEPYQPTVYCMEATGPDYESCFNILSGMPALNEKIYFGHGTSQGAAVMLPQRFTEGKKNPGWLDPEADDFMKSHP